MCTTTTPNIEHSTADATVHDIQMDRCKMCKIGKMESQNDGNLENRRGAKSEKRKFEELRIGRAGDRKDWKIRRWIMADFENPKIRPQEKRRSRKIGKLKDR